jgi:hypothetical protein
MPPQPLEIDLTGEDTVLFIHIPKTAGLSFRQIIGNYFPVQAICPAQSWVEWRQLPQETQTAYRLYRGHFTWHFGTELNRPLYLLTMLRHPVARTLSHFAHIQRERAGLPRVHDVVRGENMTLPEFITHPHFKYDAVELQTRFIAAEECIHNGLIHLRRYGGLKLAQERLQNMAFFGITERFTESLQLLAYTFGWYPVRHYQWFNRAASAQPVKTAVSNDELEQTIADENPQDLALYEFAVQVFEERLAQMREELRSRYAAGTQARREMDDDLLHDLLLKHYQARYTEHHPVVSTIEHHMDGPVWGEGWYLPDLDPNNGYGRWSGPGEVSTLHFSVAKTSDLDLSFCVMVAIANEVMRSLQVRVDGVPIHLKRHHDVQQGMIFQGEIAQASLQPALPYLEIQFSVSRTYYPAEIDPDNPDPRRVGIMLNWVKITPVRLASSE